MTYSLATKNALTALTIALACTAVTHATAGNVASGGGIVQRQPTDYIPSSYTWTSSATEQATTMKPVSEAYCFLVGVAGKFAGGGDAVWVYDVNGYWTLGGRANSGGTWAEARCIEYTNIPQVAHADAPTSSGWSSADNTIFGSEQSFCTLGGIVGNSNGGSVSIERSPSGAGGYWDMSVFGLPNAYGAFSQCLSLSGYDMPGNYDYESPTVDATNSLDLGSTYDNKVFCALSEVGGAFAGMADKVWLSTQLVASPSGGVDLHWFLNVDAISQRIYARARCTLL